MRLYKRSDIIIISLILILSCMSCNTNNGKTELQIRGNKFYINGSPTYKGKSWQEHSIEGLLFNSLMNQAVFDDSNESTEILWKYPDTGKWDPDRNTNEFVKAMQEWHKYGLTAVTINLQGGNPTGYGNNGWINTAFEADGTLKKKYFTRLYRILKQADGLGMAVILELFYFGQDQELANEQAVINAVDNTLSWLNEAGFRNVIIGINDECDAGYNYEILQPARIHELINRIRNTSFEGYRYPAGVSYSSGTLPGINVVGSADVIFLHADGIDDPDRIREMARRVKVMPEYNAQPVVFNKDDNYGFDSEDYNLIAAIESYASWGYFDYRRKGEGFEEGFGSMPVDWGINSERKRSFFNRLKEITGGPE